MASYSLGFRASQLVEADGLTGFFTSSDLSCL